MQVIKYLYRFSFVLLLANFALDVYLTLEYGGIDLRDKIVAARLLWSEESMYTFKWVPDFPQTLLDATDDSACLYNNYTGTPFQSLVLYPMALLPYSSIRIIWLVMQYVLFCGTVYFFTKNTQDTYKKKWIWIVAIFAFMTTASWHLHVERGQLYILFVFLMSYAFSVLNTKSFQSGILWGILVLFKPTYLLLATGFVWKLKIRILSGIFIVLLVGLLFFKIGGLQNTWIDYFQAMKAWQKVQTDGLPMRERHATFTLPNVIENCENLTLKAPIYVENSSLQFTVKILFKRNIGTFEFYIFYGLVFLILHWFFFKPSQKFSLVEHFLLSYVLWWFLTICMTAPRWNYQYVHWLIPCLYMIQNFEQLHPKNLYLSGIGCLLNLGVLSGFIPFSLFLGECFLCLSLILFLLKYNFTLKYFKI
jgi:hypothetical protein